MWHKPEGIGLGDDCPVCGHLIETGAHELREIPGTRPLLLCPSFAEFYMSTSVVPYDENGKPPKPSDGPLRCDPGEDDLTRHGHWRFAATGRVQFDQCWRCDAMPVNLAPDPVCPDSIGICGNCLTDRVAIAATRQ